MPSARLSGSSDNGAGAPPPTKARQPTLTPPNPHTTQPSHRRLPHRPQRRHTDRPSHQPTLTPNPHTTQPSHRRHADQPSHQPTFTPPNLHTAQPSHRPTFTPPNLHTTIHSPSHAADGVPVAHRDSGVMRWGGVARTLARTLARPSPSPPPSPHRDAGVHSAHEKQRRAGMVNAVLAAG